MIDARDVAAYFDSAAAALAGIWSEEPLRRFAALSVPADIRGSHQWLVGADAHLTWTRWFIDGFVDSRRYVVDSQLKYSHLYVETCDQLRSDNPTLPSDELKQAATAISELAWSQIQLERQRRRRSISPSLKSQLWFAAEPTPRCYLCGYAFSALARDRLLSRGSRRLGADDLPLVVDFTRPRGRKVRDLNIEIDHVRPVAAGGETDESNLRLSCGWCNSVKSSHSLLYDAPAASFGTIKTEALGVVALPQPLWVLRTVATRARCEDPSGCNSTIDDHELYLGPANVRGALNPVNCRVFCADHDPWSTARYVGRTLFENFKVSRPPAVGS